MHSLRAITALLAFTLATSVASADIITLTDGRTFTGTIRRDGDQMIIQPVDPKTAAPQKPVTTSPDNVKSVTLTSTPSPLPTPSQSADALWKKSVEQIKAADDIATILTLHQSFLDQFPSSSLAPAVKISLAEYQKLSRQSPVKFRGTWMPADQVDTTLRLWKQQAQPTLALYNTNRMAEASQSALDALGVSPDNPDLLTLAGLAAFRLNDLNAARKHFTQLAATNPGSSLAENNLAVIGAESKDLADSLTHYAKALQIAPSNRLLLDNITQDLALYIARGADKNAPIYRDLLRQFDQAEGRLESEMAKQNLYRFASTWVTFDQFALLTRASADPLQIAGTQRMMELGEDQLPPPPAPLAAPAHHLATAPLPPPASAPMPEPIPLTQNNITHNVQNNVAENNIQNTQIENTQVENNIQTYPPDPPPITGNIVQIFPRNPPQPPPPPPAPKPQPQPKLPERPTILNH